MKQQNSTNRLKSELKGFEEAFNRLPKNQIMPIRVELMNELKWSISMFYYKKRGDSPIWENEVSTIEEIFGRFGINIWNGQSIQK